MRMLSCNNVFSPKDATLECVLKVQLSICILIFYSCICNRRLSSSFSHAPLKPIAVLLLSKSRIVQFKLEKPSDHCKLPHNSHCLELMATKVKQRSIVSLEEPHYFLKNHGELF